MTATQTQTIRGTDAIEYAERTGAKLSKYADPTEGAREGLSVEEAREVAAEDPQLIWVQADTIRCECGEATGVRCEWVGPESKTVTVEWMPVYLRESHRAAGNSGDYPANGSERLRCSEDCAAMLEEDNGEWASVVS